MFNTLREYYVDRNTKIIRRFMELTYKKATNVREAASIVGDEFDVSSNTVDKVIYDKKYAHAAEAWAIIHKEEEEKEKGKDTATMAIAKDVATA